MTKLTFARAFQLCLNFATGFAATNKHDPGPGNSFDFGTKKIFFEFLTKFLVGTKL